MVGDDVEMLNLVNECVNNPDRTPDGLVLSIPGPSFQPAIQNAVNKNIPVISVNSGSNLFQNYSVAMHVGQDEYSAGKGAAKKLHESLGLAITPVFLCIGDA